jgi:hypothetical protein
MADINPDVIGTFAAKRHREFYGTWGKLNKPYFKETLASLNNSVAAIGIIRARTQVVDFRYSMAALGAGTGIKIGYVEIDDPSVNDDDAFATEADTSSATNGRGDAFTPITFENDVYIIVTETGSADASGLVEFLPEYNYLGGK